MRPALFFITGDGTVNNTEEVTPLLGFWFYLEGWQP